MRIALSVFGTIILSVVVVVLFIYSGIYNVAATDSHNSVLRWALNTAMMRSVRAHADEIAVPPLTDAAMIQKGGRHFQESCQTCHGAPGAARSELGQGLRPTPPDLSNHAQRWSPAELFWIVKHGLKMTGMPAWGPTHSDEELWAIVAFLTRLPQLSAEEYRTMIQTSRGEAIGRQGENSRTQQR